MKIPLRQMLIRVSCDEIMSIMIVDRPNCKCIQRCVTGAGSLHDPVLDDYMQADVCGVSVNVDGILALECVI